MIIHEYMHHPIELSFFYEGDAYAARCYWVLGDKEEALRYAQKALDHISQMPHTPYKDFIIETYEWIMK
ncbi:hypothetical protein [Paenibacillus eucommiae]|uniref:Tetratricopeptide (TPR) repeat protein n=1 Tax=Paenibacillus eucommiae TaxID=1355755 RepID=A0ABS4J9N3_9BACL|nr:hypothetical protein [Paenibacillus eucommiae]MBP1995429.1 tetratricopeptide (TPR) repeat protein [Paenibacillus eucommiae]